MRIPRPKWPALNFRLPAPRLALRGSGGKGALLYLGAGGAVLAGLGALLWLVVGPAFHGRGGDPPADASAPVQAAALAPVAAPPAEPSEKSAPTPQAAADRDSSTQPAAVAAASSEPEGEAARLVRQLQDVQERIAGGDRDAYAELPRLLRAIAQTFGALPPDSWEQKQNARALALYLLSGGASTVGRRIAATHQIAPSDEALVKGAIAYLDGIDCAERDGLLALDPRALDPALGAQVAFVQSILLASVDREKAIARLDLARLLAPGGLVEEAALRREIGLTAEAAEFDKFASLSRQYWGRFRRSPYADNFLNQFMSAVARVAALIKIEQWMELDDFVNGEAPEIRRAIYLAMAKTAAVAGNSAFAFLAAQRALALAPPDTVDRQRALLYRGAAQVAEVTEAQADGLLREIERRRLPVADQPLYDATAMVAARIFRAPERVAAPPPEANTDPVLTEADARLRDADAAMEDARRSMERKTR